MRKRGRRKEGMHAERQERGMESDAERQRGKRKKWGENDKRPEKKAQKK